MNKDDIEKKIIQLDEEISDLYEERDQIDVENEIQKNIFVNEILEHGEDYFEEINERNERADKLKKKYVKYIYRNQDKKSLSYFSKKQLNSLSFQDIHKMYNELREQKKNRISNFFKFFQ